MRIETVRVRIVLGAALAVSCILPARASNVTFSIFDPSSDIISVSDDNLTGRLVISPSSCPGTEGPTSPCFFTILAPTGTGSFTVTMGGTAASTVELLDPGLTPPTVSDILQQSDSTASATFWNFFSGTGLNPVSGALSLMETGAPLPTLVITYFNVDRTQIGTDTFIIQSDVPAIPEPATVVTGLSGLVLVGVGLLRRRSVVQKTGLHLE